jgi:predicted ATP-grasp superfamily ATP-dependent carboligase
MGNSSCSVSIALSEVAEACRGLDRLLAGLGYRGIFRAEFKRDPRDGVDRLLEINARPWWYIGFAAECGFNAAAMAHRDALGLEVPEVTTYRVGRRCVYRRIDLKACFRDYRQGELGLWGLATEWLRGSSPIFKWTDPGPGLAAMAGSARNLVRVRPPRTSP